MTTQTTTEMPPEARTGLDPWRIDELPHAPRPQGLAWFSAVGPGVIALGVSIGKVLRDLAVDMRKRRRQSAEERAQKTPTKILFPLVGLILPAMFILTLGPVMMRVMDFFGSN